MFPAFRSVVSRQINLPSTWGVLRIPQGGELDSRLEAMVLTFKREVLHHSIASTLWSATIEFPGMWATSQTSVTSAARGDLFKLAALCGAFAVLLWENGTRVKFISPQEWKGQLPKDVVQQRLEKRWGITGIPNHALDAVGMGVAEQNGL